MSTDRAHLYDFVQNENSFGPCLTNKQLRVLVVDDNQDAADLFGRLIELHGANVRVAYDGESARARLNRIAQMWCFRTYVCRALMAKPCAAGSAISPGDGTFWLSESPAWRKSQIGKNLVAQDLIRISPSHWKQLFGVHPRGVQEDGIVATCDISNCPSFR